MAPRQCSSSRKANNSVFLGLTEYILPRAVPPFGDRPRGFLEQLEESQKKNAEITAQLENLTAEMEKMRSDADAQIENMKKDIERKAQEDIEAIRQNAKRSVQDELARAQQQLKKETAQAALELAEELIKQQIETQDQQRLFASFTQAVEEAPNV